MTPTRSCEFCGERLVRKCGGNGKEPHTQFESRRFCNLQCCGASTGRPPAPGRILSEGVATLCVRLDDGRVIKPRRRSLEAWMRAGYIEREDDELRLTASGERYLRGRSERAA